MSKSAEAFRTISEVSEILETPTHVLRFWEGKFPQVKPIKRAGGRRYYRPADVALLGGIKRLLHEDGLTIRGVQKVLRERGIGHVMALSEVVVTAEAPDSPPDAEEAPIALDVVAAEGDPFGRVVQLIHSGIAPVPTRDEPAPCPRRDAATTARALRDIAPGQLPPVERLRLLSLYDRACALRGRMTATGA
ncbi:MerR family transcriptional regulator [Paenirhodobacter sp.]|uniref:MerR family transcriptional regulator n=1 Tax=Paenirhodobacter sp. TaxID=1965326 RepID=UPI003B3E66C2